MYNIRVVDVKHYTPEKVVSNDALSKVVDTSDEWIHSRTGISNRCVAEGQNTSDLAYEACKNMDLEGVDLIVLATFTPDKYAPATASILQKKLGIENASCLDINAGCTGFIYALKTASAMLSSGMHKKALVVGAEVITKVLNWEDRGTCVLFGDGCGAFLVEATDEAKLHSIYTNGIADKEDALTVDGVENSSIFYKGEDVEPYVKMQGIKVFKFATKALNDGIEKALELANLTIDDIKVIIPHQANERIIKQVSKGNDIPLNKFYLNIDRYGNTSSASIPIAISEAIADGAIQKGDKVLLVGFGAGLTWGSAIIEF